MDKIKELKNRLRYNQKNGYILTGKDVKTLIDYIESVSDRTYTDQVKTLVLSYSATDLNNGVTSELIDLSNTDKEIMILSVTAQLVGTPMNTGGTYWVYLGEIGSPIQMFEGSPSDLVNNYYIFDLNESVGLADINRQKICIWGEGVTGGDTDTLLTIYITYKEYAN